MEDVRVVERGKSRGNIIRAQEGTSNNGIEGTEMKIHELIQIFRREQTGSETIRRQGTERQDGSEGSGHHVPEVSPSFLIIL